MLIPLILKIFKLILKARHKKCFFIVADSSATYDMGFSISFQCRPAAAVAGAPIVITKVYSV
jgi:hypothetical protein